MGEHDQDRYGRIEYYRGADGDWRWRAIADNGRVVGDSAEGYENKADAENGLKVLASLVVRGKTTVAE